MSAMFFAYEKLVKILCGNLAEQHQFFFFRHILSVSGIVHYEVEEIVARSHECRFHLTHVHHLQHLLLFGKFFLSERFSQIAFTQAAVVFSFGNVLQNLQPEVCGT